MSLGRHPAERRIDSQVFGRQYHVQRNPAFRLAGRIFVDSDLRTQERTERRQSLQKSRPYGIGYGIGFAAHDAYGPDETWDSRDDLRDTHGPDHYIVGESHGFSVDSY